MPPAFPEYDAPLYRPPSEGGNLIIQATLGCSFNRCSFCSMYRSKRFCARPLEEIYADIDRAAAVWPEAHRVFLADGDALTLPAADLLGILQHLAERLPRLARVSCYATPANILRKTPAELAALREHRLTLLYLGIESGSPLILRKVTKGATQRGIATAMGKAEEAGMKVSATVILGLGGRGHWEEHIDGTLELLNRAPATYLSTLQLYLEPAVQEEFATKFGEPFLPQDDRGILGEQARLIGGLDPPRPLVFRSNHVSNALALAGNLPRDRGRLLNQVERAMAGDEGLRPHFLRGL